MTDLIPYGEIKSISAQIDRHGHVGIAGVYKPELAALALHEALNFYPRFHYQPHLGGTTGRIKSSLPSASAPNLSEVLDSIGEQAEQLDSEFWPTGNKPVVDIIRMQPNAKGLWHTDRIAGVAITTLQSSSRLAIECGVVYDMEPDVVVYMDRLLSHKAFAGPTGERIGLAISVEE